MTDAREAAAMNLHMHDQGTTYGEHLAEQIIEQFKDAHELARYGLEYGGPDVVVCDNKAKMPRAK
jgi:hypothetical protein